MQMHYEDLFDCLLDPTGKETHIHQWGWFDEVCNIVNSLMDLLL